MKFSKLIESFYNLFKNRRTRQILTGLILGLFLALGSAPVFSQVPPADPSDPQQWFEKAEQLDREGQWKDAIANLREAAKLFEGQNEERLAVTLANIGRIQLRVGQSQAALNTWKETREHYDRDRFPNFNRRIAVYEARALQALGHDLEACDRLANTLGISAEVCHEKKLNREEIETIIEKESDRIQKQSVYGTSWRIFGEVLRVLGKLETSQDVLNSLLNRFPTNPETKIKAIQATTFLELGNTLRARGNLERDRQSPPKYDYLPWRCEPIDNLGNYRATYQNAIENYENADKEYKRVIDFMKQEQKFSSRSSLVKATLNHLTLLLDMVKLGAIDPSELSTEDFDLDISAFPLSQNKVYTKIKVAKSQACLSGLHSEEPHWTKIAQQLQTALDETKKLENDDTKSFVLGNKGSFYEYHTWWLENNKNIAQKTKQLENKEEIQLCQNTEFCYTEAQKWTQEALYLAQSSAKPSIAYQWEWQLGRLLATQGETEDAIAFYEAATKTLESVRSDLLSINSDVQFNFRDNVEPVYRGLVNLLLPTGETKPRPENLWKAIYYIDSLQLAELSNFLKCDLGSDAITASLTQFNANKNPVKLLERKIKEVLIQNPKTALVYPIIFEDKISVIVKTAFQENPLYYEKISTRKIIDSTIAEARDLLTDPDFDLPSANQLQDIYNWFMADFIFDLKDKLDREIITTLAFVLDDSLQSIPIVALHNGEKFVVQEKYDTVVMPTVQVLDANRNSDLDLTALIAGSTVQINDINSNQLESGPVQSQIKIVSEFFPTHKILFEQEGLIFTKGAFKKAIQSSNYNVVHLVTHGEFSSDPEATIIVTEDKNNPFININDFRKILSDRDSTQLIELLVLSACKTAQGDKRATLGIAGVAIASGANGTIAPLWDADQESTGELIKRFYNNLVNGDNMSKAAALHKAQKSLKDEIENPNLSNPSHWAPFILVGN